MSQLSDYGEGQLRAHAFRTATWTKPTVIAVCLCTSATADANTGATIPEVTNANGYARQTLNPLDANWSAPDATGGLTANLAAITFPACTTATWGTVTHFALTDSAIYAAGNMLVHGPLTVSKAIGVGDVFSFPIAALAITFA